MEWGDVVEKARTAVQSRDLAAPYHDRLKFEIAEVEKQGAETIWVNRLRDGKRFSSNPNNLVLPWLLGMVGTDPISERKTPALNTARAAKVLAFKETNGYVPHDLVKDLDSPDIDLDCLPSARDPIKQFAIETYGQDFNDGYGSVCSVGTWTTYKFKSAIQDAAVALGIMDLYAIQEYTTRLPEDVDELREGGRAPCKNRLIKEMPDGTREEKECGCVHASTVCPNCQSEDTDGPTIGKLLVEQPLLQELATKHPQIVEVGINLIGRVRSMGMHAGAIIITDRPLYGNVPMARSGRNGYWVSMWTEGRNTQLSKFGYIKWDILGLKTLGYIFNCCKMIEENRGISFGHNMSGWDDIDPTQRRAGHFFDHKGNKHYISLDDPVALGLANQQKTDGVFQFDTDLAKSILAYQSTCFEDLMLFNAMGHPGPMASIPEAVENRANKNGHWRKRLHPLILKVLEDTYGVIVYQEQLQAIWQLIAGFTAPEAQEARKAVAKKLTHKLKPIREKWISGATRLLGKDEAEGWWPKMETFGRYAFNKCLAAGTSVVDCVTGEMVAIEYAAGHYLHSEHGPDRVVAIHDCGVEPVYSVTFSNGVTETVTAGHRYLTDCGYRTLALLSSGTHAVKYVRESVRSGGNDEIAAAGRIRNSEALPPGLDLRNYYRIAGSESHVAQLDLTCAEETFGNAALPLQAYEPGQAWLSGRLDADGVLLDWVADGGWLCRREEGVRLTRSSSGRCGYRLRVCGLLRRVKADVAPSDGEVKLLQQTIDRQVAIGWGHRQEIRGGDASNPTTHERFRAGVPGWRWDGRGEWQGLSDGWIRFELPVHIEPAVLDFNVGSHAQSEQAGEAYEYTQLVDVNLDWLETVCGDIVVDLPESKSCDGSQDVRERLDIVSVKFAGYSRVYSPEMASPWHNYAIAPGHPIAANSHAVSYCLMAHRCLWLKGHFAPEFWASVMSDCHPDKLVRYMGVARAEGWKPTDITYCGKYKGNGQPVNGVKFHAVNIENMSTDFTVTGDTVNQGLIGIKGLGEAATKVFQGRGKYADIDEFVASGEGKQSKIALERFVKLGAFRHLPGHENDKALWMWYQYKYCKSGKDMTDLRKKVKAELLDREGWDEKAIVAERQRQIAEWKKVYPKRNKIPDKYKNWLPKPTATREKVMALYAEDEYTLEERLAFQKQFLGYWLESPMEQFQSGGGCNIAQAKLAGAAGNEVLLEGMILDVQEGTTKTNKPYLKMFITDGIQRCLVFIWTNELRLQDLNTIREHVGVAMYVDYDTKRSTFSLVRGEIVNRLKRKK